MTPFTRETIYAAAFARALTATWAAFGPDSTTTFKSSGRKLQHWDGFPVENMPYLGQRQDRERQVRPGNKPPMWLLQIEWYVYLNTLAQGDATIVPSTQINTILDALQAALEPNAGGAKDGSQERCTLGGLVYECKISEKEIEDFEGYLGDLGVVIVPVEILVPA